MVQADFVFEGAVCVVIPAVIIPDSAEIATDDYIIIPCHIPLLWEIFKIKTFTKPIHGMQAEGSWAVRVSCYIYHAPCLSLQMIFYNNYIYRR